jgi:hypothetical protein
VLPTRFAQDLLSETTAELLRTGTFTVGGPREEITVNNDRPLSSPDQTLTSTLQMENNKRAAVADTVTREREVGQGQEAANTSSVPQFSSRRGWKSSA